MQSLGHKPVISQNLDYTSNQRTSLTKIATFGILMDNIGQSFSHKTVILSQSNIHIQ